MTTKKKTGLTDWQNTSYQRTKATAQEPSPRLQDSATEDSGRQLTLLGQATTVKPQHSEFMATQSTTKLLQVSSQDRTELLKYGSDDLLLIIYLKG